LSTDRGHGAPATVATGHDLAVIDTSAPEPSRASRCWTLWLDGAPFDVELTAGDQDAVGAVLPALGRTLGRPVSSLWHGSTPLADDRPLSAPELVHGAELGCDGPAPGSAGARRSSALELHVVGGPAAGHIHPLGQGRHVIGRSREVDVQLDDPGVSRRHARLDVGGGAITVSDAGSTNGTRLDGTDLTGDGTVWSAGALLRIGASALMLAGPGGAAAALEAAPGGRLLLRPTPRPIAPLPEVEVAFPSPPAPPPRRRLAWVAVALPAVAGGAMAWLLATPTFLFFALLSPVVALGTWLSERWSGSRRGRREAKAHAVETAAAEARVAEAVLADGRTTDAAHPNLATLAAAARRRSHLLWCRSALAPEAPIVRVGSGPGDTRVRRRLPDGSRVRETAPSVPVVVDLAAGGGLAVAGPRERVLGVLRGVIAQLVALHAPGDVDLLLLTDARHLPDWGWARWLPHLAPPAVQVPTPDAERSEEALHAWLTGLIARRSSTAGAPRVPGPRLVVLVDRELGPELAATLRRGRDAGILVLSSAASTEQLPVPVDAVLTLTGETGDQAVLREPGAPERTVSVDRMPCAVAADLARDLAPLAPAGAGGGLPSAVRLLDLPSVGLHLDDEDGLGGSWSRARDRLVSVLGRSGQGPVELDLVRQGPHALIAGTTGSGKSELLQTLITSLALNHPPDRCSFLLVDYKGGAAFADAADLPHTVGVVTDLDGQSTERALRSLSAELARREAILARHRVAEISALPDEVDLARLVIVVDEFATLAEELPSFVPGLVGIAQRGRSLGVHLVLATQRPGGVVSPEIRANCTLRICLRTTDEADSRDVLGTTAAAFLPIDLPGRAYLRSGSGSPTLFQVARVATPTAPLEDTRPDARPWSWEAARRSPAAPSPATGLTDLGRACRALSLHALAGGLALPHRPWRAPLPDQIAAALPVDAAGTGAVVAIGLVDRPDRQVQEPLHVDLDDGGVWLAVGAARSGRTTVLRTVLGEAVHRFGPDELHVHVLESGGGSLASDAAGLPHTGTTVSGDDALRTVRLVDRLAQEVAGRRTGTIAGPLPRLLLLVDGVEAITTLLDEHDPGRGSGALLRLMRDGAAVGLTCVVTADRAVPGGRLAALARQRLVLPLADAADYGMAGIPARAVPTHRPPGRALLGEEAAECQVALPRPLLEARGGTASASAIRVVELPADPALPAPSATQRPPRRELLLPVGPGGDAGQTAHVDLLRSGGLLVTGPPGSGRSTALQAFADRLRENGAAVLTVGRSRGHDVGRPDADWLDPSDVRGMTAWLADHSGLPAVVVADDVGAPGDCPALMELGATGAGSGPVLLAAGSPSAFSGHFQGPVAALRRARAGLLLCPGPGDADILGIRLPRTPVPVRPGSGWLVTGSAVDRVQVARRSTTAVGGPQAQRSSSAGPISCRAYQPSS
jgi:S-DNA-T family DNA segregation ATPase FtsK/SpoIIIE